MNPQGLPAPRPPFNDELYRALSPLADTMKTKQELARIRMKYDPVPKKAPQRNNAAVGPQGEIYE